MNIFYLNETEDEQQQDETKKQYFEIELGSESKFQLSQEDWSKLKSIQKGHRFLRGEWEDYFVLGMKESNKYCVFAFKDHYVNQTNFRKREAKMENGTIGDMDASKDLKGKKLFSANGYCVFEDCSVKFCLKMNDELVVHVFYSGKLKHSVNEVHARYFRGKSRQELKNVLKHTTPLKEYLQRVQTSGSLEAGNADYVGKSTSVYRRIAAEAKDSYQGLIQLRSQLIEKSLIKLNKLNSKPELKLISKHLDQTYLKGYIHLIQYIPGSIVCFNHEQICLFNSLSSKCLYLSQFGPDYLTSTTINSKNLSFFEMCIKCVKSDKLIPLSFMLTTEPVSKFCSFQWFNLFLSKKRLVFGNENENLDFVIIDNSLPLVESLLEAFFRLDLNTYLNICFKTLYSKENCLEFNLINLELFNSVREVQLNKTSLHICSNQFIIELKCLCKQYYSYSNNFNFGMYAFSCIINSESLSELQISLYSFMTILYSKTINSIVEKSFKYLKQRVNQLELNSKASKCLFYIYNPNCEFESNPNTSGISQMFKIHPKLNSESVFYIMCEKLFEKCKKEVDLCEKEEKNCAKNPRMGHKLLYHFINQFSSSIPLWVKLDSKEMSLDLMIKTRHEPIKALISSEDEKESVDLFIKKLEEFNENLIEDSIKIYGLNLNQSEFEPRKSIILAQLVNDTSQEVEEDLHLNLNEAENFKLKRSKTELIKPKINTNKKLKEQDQRAANESELFNLVSLKESENEEREVVIERECHIITSEFGVQLSKEDLETLEAPFSLNSNIIEFYFKLLESSSECKNCLILPISFYPNLKYSSNFLSQNIFDFSLILVPIQKTDHWALSVIDFIKQKITYYDCLLVNDFDCLKLITEFIDKEYSIKYSKKYDFQKWKISNEKNIGKNINLKDTGLFILYYSRRLIHNLDLNLNLTDELEKFRNQIKREIFEHIFK